MAPSSDSFFSHRTQPPPPSENSSNRRLNLSWLLPVGLLVGFLVVAWALFGERLLPARSVQLATVAVIDSGFAPGMSASQPVSNPWEAPVLFQASGWVEPDPFPIRATALTDGVIEEVLVLEGMLVSKGEVLATLIDEDARLALAGAEARLGEARSALQIAEAHKEIGRAALKAREARTESARARLAELKDDADRLDRIGADAVSAGEITRAALRVDAQRAILASREAEVEEGKAEITALEGSVVSAARGLEDAKVIRDERELALDRTVIRSPVDGIIQRLLAAPGQKKMLGMDDRESATVAVLFQPDSLQARIDVPLEQAAGLFPGQAVWVRTNFLPDARFRGRVDRIVGEADLQRNTLQAKVVLLDTDHRFRPEMLCRAEFLAPSTEAVDGATESPSTRGGKLLLFVPDSAITQRSADQALIWTVDPSDRTLKSRQIVLGSAVRDGFVQVLEGVRPGQQVVIDPPVDLVEGERIDGQIKDSL